MEVENYCLQKIVAPILYIWCALQPILVGVFIVPTDTVNIRVLTPHTDMIPNQYIAIISQNANTVQDKKYSNKKRKNIIDWIASLRSQ